MMKIYNKIIIKPLRYVILLSFFSITLFSQEGKTETINLVLTNDIIGDVNRNDARASIEAVMSEVLGNSYFDANRDEYNVEKIAVQIVNSLEEIKSLVKDNSADIVGISSINYIKLKEELNISPLFAVQVNEIEGTSYVLVARNNDNINSLADLKSKTVLTINNFDREIADKWLFVEMQKEKVSNSHEIIKSFTKTLSPSKRILSVFFNKADCAIVSREQFESACELNPQISKKLKVLYESPSIITQVFCINNNSIKKGLSITKEFIKQLNETENGSKLVKLFKAMTLTSVNDQDIATIAKICRDHIFYTDELQND